MYVKNVNIISKIINEIDISNTSKHYHIWNNFKSILTLFNWVFCLY